MIKIIFFLKNKTDGMNKKYTFVILRPLFDTTDNSVYLEQCKNPYGRKTERSYPRKREMLKFNRWAQDQLRTFPLLLRQNILTQCD